MTRVESPDPRITTALVALAALVSFAPGLWNEFLGDDRILVLQRLDGLAWSQLPGLLRENYWGPHAVPQHYRPLGLVVLAVERLLFGDVTALYHALALLGHTASSLLVVRILRRLGFERAAFPAALLFAVHPIHAESVLTVYGQLDLFASLCVLVGLERTIEAHRTGRSGPLWVAWTVYAVGIGFKESAAVLPALTVLARGLCLTPNVRGIGRWVTRAEWGFAAPLVLMLLLRWPVLGGLSPPTEATYAGGEGIVGHLRLILVSAGNSLRLIFVPTTQTPYYGSLPAAWATVPWREVAWLVAVPALALASSRVLGARVALFAAGWFAITVAPVSNLVPVYVLVAERSLYLPALGATLLAGAWIAHFAPTRRALARVALAVLVLLPLAASWRVTWLWRTELSMWLYTAFTQPENPRAFSAVGGIYLNRHMDERRLTPTPEDLDLADSFFSAALELTPWLDEALLGKAGVALARNDCAGALVFLDQARQLKPLEPRAEHRRRLCVEELRRR